jgi:hypothetical protein
MSNTARFRVDPRLARLLGEGYRSSEQALRELVDNAWDADAEHVWIDLPAEDLPNMTRPDGEIRVRDDGSGMTEQEVRNAYLLVARGRISKGEFTAGKNRRVKGRKGIGKFAGLVMADRMAVETVAREKLTAIDIERAALLDSSGDLEEVALPIRVEDATGAPSGTTVILRDLSQSLRFPDPQRVRQILALEYRHVRDFTIFVNDQKLVHEDIPGETKATSASLPQAGMTNLRFTIMDKPKAREAGIAIRVGGKVVGKPTFFGLDEDETIPRKALQRLVGEVDADKVLEEGAVTADWGGFIENNLAFQEIREWVIAQIRPEIERVFAREVNLAKARRQKEINRRLEQLPEYRREFAKRELDRIFCRFWTDSDGKIDTMVSLVLDAFDKDEYYLVCEHIEQASQGDVVRLAEALGEFGLTDMAIMAQQARRRLQFLDHLDRLASDEKTLEATIHKALETNLWIFGAEYSLISSNQTLRRVLGVYLDGKFAGNRADWRPDLFLGQDVHDRKLLIEFKRPKIPVGREAERQAREYRDDLTPQFGHMQILIIGGQVDEKMSSQYEVPDVTFMSYNNVISRARRQLQWLLTELIQPASVSMG